MARPDQHAQADAPAEQLASSQQLNSKQRRKLLRQQQRQQQSQATMSGASPAAKPGPPNRAGQPLAEPAAIEAAPAAAPAVPAVPEDQPPADPVTQVRPASPLIQHDGLLLPLSVVPASATGSGHASAQFSCAQTGLAAVFEQAKAALQQLVASKRAVNHQMNQLTGQRMIAHAAAQKAARSLTALKDLAATMPEALKEDAIPAQEAAAGAASAEWARLDSDITKLNEQLAALVRQEPELQQAVANAEREARAAAALRPAQPPGAPAAPSASAPAATWPGAAGAPPA